MQVRARRFVCKATFTSCISVCSQFSATLTEVRAKLRLQAYKTSKRPLWLNYIKGFYFRNTCKKKTKAGNKYKPKYTWFSYFYSYRGQWPTVVLVKTVVSDKRKLKNVMNYFCFRFSAVFTEVRGLQYKSNAK